MAVLERLLDDCRRVHGRKHPLTVRTEIQLNRWQLRADLNSDLREVLGTPTKPWRETPPSSAPLPRRLLAVAVASCMIVVDFLAASTYIQAVLAPGTGLWMEAGLTLCALLFGPVLWAPSSGATGSSANGCPAWRSSPGLGREGCSPT